MGGVGHMRRPHSIRQVKSIGPVSPSTTLNKALASQPTLAPQSDTVQLACPPPLFRTAAEKSSPL
jgi:hypothetical protein